VRIHSHSVGETGVGPSFHLRVRMNSHLQTGVTALAFLTAYPDWVICGAPGAKLTHAFGARQGVL